MTDQQLLGIDSLSDKTIIRAALANKISDLDFEIDIERIFSYILCAKRLIQKTDHETTDARMLMSETNKELWLNLENEIHSPEILIEQLTNLYNSAEGRSNKSLWKKAIEQVKESDNENPLNYCQAIADFLNQNLFLPSEILALLANSFPFSNFFPDPTLEENKPFWEQYNYTYHLLRHGNRDFDLLAHTVDHKQFTPTQADEIYYRLTYSARYYREKQYAEAFTLLSQGIPGNLKPLVVWQRMLNILYVAAFKEQEKNAEEVFEQALNDALSYYPTDEHLLYMRAKLSFQTSPPEHAKEVIIDTLKRIPDHSKCLFLLGKCYMKLGIARAALVVFENLKKVNPLQMQYVTAAAVASRNYIDFCIQEYDPKDNSKEYYIRMISTLIEQSMFDEASVFATQAPKDDVDIAALLMYAQAVEAYAKTGDKDAALLKKSLSDTKNKEIIRKIKAHYLEDLPEWSDVKKESAFILAFYNEYPKDAMANYHSGMLYYATQDYKQAYDYFLKAKIIEPSNISIYYNLARAAGQYGMFEEAIQYISVYLQHNKYNVLANQLCTEWLFSLKQFDKAHTNAKWTLSLCRPHEFLSSHFFYFTVSLGLYLNNIPKENINPSYIYDILELYDQYPKPENFWGEDNGPKSMYWAAKLCHNIGDNEKCVQYIKTILQHTSDQHISPIRLSLVELLAQSLNAWQQYEELTALVVPPLQELLANDKYIYGAGNTCLYTSIAYGKLKYYSDQMEWAIKCVHCYMQADTPPLEWLDNYLVDTFTICIDNDVDLYLIPIGSLYLDLIKKTTINHIWMSHNMANAYDAFDHPKDALFFHKICLEYGMEFPGECEEEITGSQNYINTHSTSNSVK